MALYHMHVDIITRSAGKSAVGSVGYQFRMNVTDMTTGEKMYYSKKTDKPILCGFFYPHDCAKQFRCVSKKEIAQFWNDVQEKENRKNSQFARDFDIAFQSELTTEQNVECLSKWIYENYTKRGLCASWAVHGPHEFDDGTNNKNLHAHVMVATRKVDKNGWAEKDRDGNDREFLKAVRKSWADIVNEKFKEYDIDAKIDERTLKAQGIDREPQKHIGTKATAMQRREDKNKNIVLNVSDDEIKTAMINDEEFQKLWNMRQQILKEIEKQKAEEEKQKNDRDELKIEFEKWHNRISNMQPKEWQSFMKGYGENWQESAYGEYEQTLHKEQHKAERMWVENNITELEQYFHKIRQEKVSVCNKWTANNPKPWNDAKVKEGIFRRDWYTSDGEHYGDDPVNARCHQQQLRRDWDKKHTPLEADANVAIAEHKNCLNKDFEAVRQSIYIHHQKTLLEKMIDGTKKIITESKLFYPLRAMVQAVKNLRDQKNMELKNYQQQQRNLNKEQKRTPKGFSISD